VACARIFYIIFLNAEIFSFFFSFKKPIFFVKEIEESFEIF